MEEVRDGFAGAKDILQNGRQGRKNISNFLIRNRRDDTEYERGKHAGVTLQTNIQKMAVMQRSLDGKPPLNLNEEEVLCQFVIVSTLVTSNVSLPAVLFSPTG